MTTTSALPSHTALITRARNGDHDAFRLLTEPHVRGIHVHCYRMLGSIHDAEDMLQETLFRAWRRLDGFEGRASLRSWLYRIATNACLDVLERRPRRVLPDALGPPADPRAVPAPADELTLWIEPYPDFLLDLVDDGDPARRLESRESVELAFVVAIQNLTPRARAVVILREVLGFSAREVAETLGSSVAAVNSLLQRARATLAQVAPHSHSERERRPLTADEAGLVARYIRAWEDEDVQGLVALLHEDGMLTMPPTPSWYAGRPAIAAFFATLFSGEFSGRLRLVTTRANRQPAFAVYLRDSGSRHQAFALKLLTLRGDGIEAITGFGDPSLFRFFALPAVRTF